MSTPTQDDSLIEAARALYGRLQNDALEPDDVIPLEQLVKSGCDDFANLVALLYADPATYASMLGSFKDTFDVFRIFDERQIVLDVGAHWGYSAVAMRHQGCRARILSVEAIPFNIPALQRLKSVPGSNCDYVHAAANDRPGTLRFYTPAINGQAVTGLSSTGGTLTPYFVQCLSSAWNRLATDADRAVDVRFAIHDVKALHLDALFDASAYRIEDVAALKMDIEGHEAFALRGAQRLFGAVKPLLMVEGANRDAAVVDVMTGYGYLHAERRHDGRLVPHPARSHANDGFWIHPDQVAFYRSVGLVDDLAS